MLAYLWPFRAGVHFGLEHGAGNGIATSVRSVVFWYGNQQPGLRPTDTVVVGSRGSEARHSIARPDPTRRTG